MNLHYIDNHERPYRERVPRVRRKTRVDDLEAALFYLVGDCEALHGEVRRGFAHKTTAREAENLARAKALVADYEPEE